MCQLRVSVWWWVSGFQWYSSSKPGHYPTHIHAHNTPYEIYTCTCACTSRAKGITEIVTVDMCGNKVLAPPIMLQWPDAITRGALIRETHLEDTSTVL